jgi:hypothetical protein
MRKVVTVGVSLLAVLALSLPLAFAATFMLWPVWSWAELDLGIESIGHSMPAGWCFGATYAAITVPMVSWILWRACVKHIARGA